MMITHEDRGEDRRIRTVAIAVDRDALRARLMTELASALELLPAGAAEAADVLLVDSVADDRDFDRVTVLLTDDVGLAGSALAAGAAAVLPTDVDRDTLAAVVEAALRGLVVVERSAVLHLLHEGPSLVRENAAAPKRSLELTAREQEVLALLAEGASNKAIARRLGFSVHTAKFHVASILGKLDATGRTDAVAHAVRLGLILL